MELHYPVWLSVHRLKSTLGANARTCFIDKQSISTRSFTRRLVATRLTVRNPQTLTSRVELKPSLGPHGEPTRPGFLPVGQLVLPSVHLQVQIVVLEAGVDHVLAPVVDAVVLREREVAPGQVLRFLRLGEVLVPLQLDAGGFGVLQIRPEGAQWDRARGRDGRCHGGIGAERALRGLEEGELLQQPRDTRGFVDLWAHEVGLWLYAASVIMAEKLHWVSSLDFSVVRVSSLELWLLTFCVRSVTVQLCQLIAGQLLLRYG